MSWANPFGLNRLQVEPVPNNKPTPLDTAAQATAVLVESYNALQQDLLAAAAKVAELQRQVDAHTAELIQAGETWRARVNGLTVEL